MLCVADFVDIFYVMSHTRITVGIDAVNTTSVVNVGIEQSQLTSQIHIL